MLSLELANKLTGTWVVSWITHVIAVTFFVKVYRVSVCVKQRTSYIVSSPTSTAPAYMYVTW